MKVKIPRGSGRQSTVVSRVRESGKSAFLYIGYNDDGKVSWVKFGKLANQMVYYREQGIMNGLPVDELKDFVEE